MTDFEKILHKYMAFVADINRSKTIKEHSDNSHRFEGWLDALRMFDVNVGRLMTRTDMIYIENGVDRPMCGGVFLDWSPEKGE